MLGPSPRIKKKMRVTPSPWAMGRVNVLKMYNVDTSIIERIIGGLDLIRLFSDSQNAAFELLVWYM